MTPPNPLQRAWLGEIGIDLRALDGRGPQHDPAPAARAQARSPQPPARRRSAPPRRAPALAAPVSVVAPELARDVGHLQDLTRAIEACVHCPRAQQRSRAVPGAGSTTERPWYFLVGEQPGLEDEAGAQPFQGPAGQLLQAMLASVPLPDRALQYATYAVKCRATGGQQPDAAEIDACRPWLMREIELLQPHWVVALGAVAAQALLGADPPFAALRGRTWQVTTPSGLSVPVRVTHLPSSLLVHARLKAQAWHDLLGLAQAVAAGR